METLRGRSFRVALNRALPASLLVVFAACAQVSPGEARPVPEQRAKSTVITQEEIRTAGAANAYDLVQSLRPMWLNMRGSIAHTPTAGDIIVYLGVAKLGGLAALREVSASSIVSAEYLDAPKANYRFGKGHQFGAIILSQVSK